jgi:hypothetical protein
MLCACSRSFWLAEAKVQTKGARAKQVLDAKPIGNHASVNASSVSVIDFGLNHTFYQGLLVHVENTVST